MKVLGVDFGTKNVGLAMAETENGLAFVYGTLHIDVKKRPLVKVIEDIVKLVELEKVKRVVVGMPLNLSGKKGEMGEKVFQFVEQLEEACGVKVETEDERLTTVQAAKFENKNSRNIDELSAQILLQSWLDRNK